MRMGAGGRRLLDQFRELFLEPPQNAGLGHANGCSADPFLRGDIDG